MTYDDFEEEFYQYEERFLTKQERRAKRARGRNSPKKLREEILAELTDSLAPDEGTFITTYQPGEFEEGWLISSLRNFYDQQLITDVLGQVKGGKEASVYRCQAHPSVEADLLAAKVYRPRMFRNLRNDKLYRQGRTILTGEGRAVKNNDHRIMRAIGKKTSFGQQVSQTSWLMHEFSTLNLLYRAGAAVPQPLAASENAVLMSYKGDRNRGAPTLHEIELEQEEAEGLFHEVVRNIELMLQHGLIHGDLSSFNILYWEEEITLIDFPQITDLATNREAAFILNRDITRVCDYFARQGVSCDPEKLMNELWDRYGTPTYPLEWPDL